MDEILDPKRHLALDGAHNVRDLGGYRTHNGGVTCWGRFLRAATMHRLTASDQTALLDYGVRTVVDLRRTAETEVEPNLLAQSDAVAYHHLNMLGDGDLAIESTRRYLQFKREDPSFGENPHPAYEIAAGYCGWLDLCQGMIREILETLSAGPHAALFHCAAGKDRTGVVAALLLGLAGVPEETIVADYSLTARHSIERYRSSPGADPDIRTWEDYQRRICPPETMQQVLDHLAESYGGSEQYMREVGLAEARIDRLRDALLA
jgi:protein-tyrosine phosphatase